MNDPNYALIRSEVQKVKNYEWPKKQDDSWDSLSKFIYYTRYYSELLNKINKVTLDSSSKNDFEKYVICRWYNFWTSQIIEKHIFVQHLNVREEENKYHKTIDFYIDKINFDLKCSVFPKYFKFEISTFNIFNVIKDPSELINWLYLKQSKEGRWHISNRLFIIFVNLDDVENSWVLKKQFSRLKPLINKYLDNFNKNLFVVDNEKIEGKPFSDIIFFVKEKKAFKGIFYSWNETGSIVKINKINID